jgi:hypothetical protein
MKRLLFPTFYSNGKQFGFANCIFLLYLKKAENGQQRMLFC